MAKKNQKAATPAKMGRPTLFSDRLVERLLVMATKGATEAQMAKAAGVTVTTFRNWKGQHADFLAALNDAKDLADMLVEASLYQKALGYSAPAIKFFCDKGRILSQKYVEHYPPDTTACIFWLKNRQPKRWRDRQEVQVDDVRPFIIHRSDGSALELGAKAEGEDEE